MQTLVPLRRRAAADPGARPPRHRICYSGSEFKVFEKAFQDVIIERLTIRCRLRRRITARARAAFAYDRSCRHRSRCGSFCG